MLLDSEEDIGFTLPETKTLLIQKAWEEAASASNRQSQNNPSAKTQSQNFSPASNGSSSRADDFLPAYHYPERLPESFKVSPMCFKVRRENLENIFGCDGRKNKRNRKRRKLVQNFSQYLGTGFRSSYYKFPYSIDYERTNRKRNRSEGPNESGLPEAKKRKSSLTEIELFDFFASMNQRHADSVNSAKIKSNRKKKRELYVFKKGIMRFVNQHRTKIVKMENVNLGFWARTSFIIEIRGMQFCFHGMQFGFYGMRILKKRLKAKKMIWNRIALLPIAVEVSALAKEFIEANAIDQCKINALLAKQPKVPQKQK